ncbi:AAA family ATPase [Streptomyces sp. NRRL F-5135]|uniref:AAA family ATPase n=1 Tax=Streptomyces sp. NRRL F-5135 TaxID=1463858 RepID=UPI000B313BEF|nr:AAA family ATPase [Streptomyces sp. NRRL F-5135]
MEPTEATLPLFDEEPTRPLADRPRPTQLEDVVGQDHILAPDAPLGRMVAQRRLGSAILWGPPGVGKTTIARLLAHGSNLAFEPVSATFSGVADLRKVFVAARGRRGIGQGTLLFVDEIHRFNRAQRDSFLPYVEDGTVTLIGATTENPSFELNGALLSRTQVLVLKRLDEAALSTLLDRAEQLTGRQLPLDGDARRALIALADGDGRYLSASAAVMRRRSCWHGAQYCLRRHSLQRFIAFGFSVIASIFRHLPGE